MYPPGGSCWVALMDYGVKENMIRCLQNRGCEVTVFPPTPPAETVLAGGFDGVMLSNGPGDPADNVAIIAEVGSSMRAEMPIFAVCLGHQLLALATGARPARCASATGGNQPVKDLAPAGPISPARTMAMWSAAERGPGGGRGVPHQRQRGQRGGPALQAAQLLHRPVPPGGLPGPMDTEYLFDRFMWTA